MLTLTESASVLIKNLTDQTAAADAGLRISAADPGGTLAVDLTPAPEPTDQVVESAGARVFLEENAAAALSDKVLDAQVDGEGAQQGMVRFAITDQE
jgi:iron-sulfur cluster assembly protein